MQASSRVTINTGILYVRMAITVFISLYTTRLILDALGASDFGIFSVVASTIGMLGFLNAAMSSATQRFMSYAEGEGKDEKQIQIFNASVVLHVAIGFIVVLLMEGAGYILFNGVLEIPTDRIEIAKLIFHFAVVSTWFNILSVPYDAVINAHENMLFMAIIEIIEKLLRLAIAIYITYSPYSYDKLAVFGILTAVSSLLLLLIRHFYCVRKYQEVKFGIIEYYDKSLFEEMTGFAGWSFLGSSTNMISTYGRGIVLNIFFGPVVNAAQGVANDLNGKLGAFSSTMRRALNPVIDKSEGSGDRSRMLKTSILGGKVSFFLLVLVAVPVIIEMPLILNFWLKDIPQYAVIFAQLILVLSLIRQLFITLGSSIKAVGRIRNFKIAESIANPLSLILSYIAFSMGYDPYWMYIIVILTAVIDSSIILFFANRVAGLSIPHFLKNTVFRCLFSLSIILVIAMSPLMLLEEGFIRFLVIGALSTIFLILTVWFIGLQKDEQEIFRKMILKLMNKGISYFKRYSAE